MSSTTRPRVLLADDYPGMVGAIKRLLAPDCDVVGAVTDGEALLKAVGGLQPDVIVVDLNLPNVNGLEACRRIKLANPNIKVIVFTALSDPVIMEEALAAGASAFISKQELGEKLIAAIKAACAGG